MFMLTICPFEGQTKIDLNKDSHIYSVPSAVPLRRKLFSSRLYISNICMDSWEPERLYIIVQRPAEHYSSQVKVPYHDGESYALYNRHGKFSSGLNWRNQRDSLLHKQDFHLELYDIRAQPIVYSENYNQTPQNSLKEISILAFAVHF
ncbi:hypothetical protein EDB19DRAFT_1836502 [Suillus lakei]|nr:hypothetical protein EDB19DRAFT_1836502 [Suillus lakei]